ncbi:MAG: DUF4922 domain-containing protein [Melioribacteraceae bacterium]|nr:DUF4922 domain-containing protein [Melioribacteraceae bacterium]
MLNSIIIQDKVLKDYGQITTIADRTRCLLNHQIHNWELAAKGYDSLASVEVREFEFDDHVIKVQYNPGRIISTSANVDDESIKKRKCFLCYQNLPAEQKAVAYYRDYLILVNPFPIFPEHFTIPKVDHVPQNIMNNLDGLINLAHDIGEYYTVFYNGPRCGASAPDHMHFQAGLNNFMPITGECEDIVARRGDLIFSDNELNLNIVFNSHRAFVVIESMNKSKIKDSFQKVYRTLKSLHEDEDNEPMLNVICTYNLKKWKMIIFPRSRHRPDYYFKEGRQKLLISPASVDLGGVCITPREEDFKKITRDLLSDVLRQVSVSRELYEYFKKNLSETFSVTD